ncbi:hypothetical protein [Nonomuraea sp. NPDC050786]|uniref:zinc finger domain-containing protein n=1 Tax=Nonomuraea sp. NPDC050786 TaxID=3154840 RepID=UPI0033CE3E1B
MEAHDCPMTSCAAPAGSPCRTGRGKVVVQYHTARFRLVPAQALDLRLRDHEHAAKPFWLPVLRLGWHCDRKYMYIQ